MKHIGVAALSLLLSVSGAAIGQPTPQSHEQHQATGQHSPNAGEGRCCCEQMMQEMHKMMSEMKKMHEGMAAHSGHEKTREKQPQKQ